MSEMFINEVYAPFLESNKTLQIYYGGAASGKSTFLAQRCVLDLLRGERNYLIVRNVARTLRNSVCNQIMKVITEAGLSEEFSFHTSDLVLTCVTTGCQSLFAGLDDVEKLKSITPKKGVLTDIWIEEATEVSYRSYKLLSKRLRGISANKVQALHELQIKNNKISNTVKQKEKNENKKDDVQNPVFLYEGDGKEEILHLQKRITLSFNPLGKEHWIWKEFFEGFDETAGVVQDEQKIILRTTHIDNCCLDNGDREALEQEKDPWYYEVFTKGHWASLEGAVFKNWRVETLPQMGQNSPRWGLDFGFSSDPNALLGCWVNLAQKQLFIFAELLRGGLHDDELADEVQKYVRKDVVVCDSADPKAISDLCRRGINAVPAVKGPDSVRFGLRFLQGFEILVSPNCPNTAKEMASYRWQEDKHGGFLPRPNEQNNHLMDALRYAVEDLCLGARATAAFRL